MVANLKRLFKAGKLTELQITLAVEKGWITEVQKQEIISGG